MDIYSILSIVVALTGVTLSFFKRTNLLGYSMLGVYFLIQSVQSFRSGNAYEGWLLFTIAPVVFVIVLLRYFKVLGKR